MQRVVEERKLADLIACSEKKNKNNNVHKKQTLGNAKFRHS